MAFDPRTLELAARAEQAISGRGVALFRGIADEAI